MTHNELWAAALGEIELTLSPANFTTWFKETSILSIVDNKVTIGVPNAFTKEWIENKFRNSVLQALQHIENTIVDMHCVINISGINHIPPLRPIDGINGIKNENLTHNKPFNNQQNPLSETKNSAYAQTYTPSQSHSNLNPRYVFDTFVTAESNELARAACQAVCENLGTLYNPLFIYGNVGLGKTHLLQSIGNRVLQLKPDTRVKYITSERFTSELIDSIRNQKIARFKEYYQRIDLLIIDDVQFLSGKEKTQQEFFHIFNALYQLNKQIVISSDRPPQSIPTLEDRLRSRFEGGMITDVGIPDLETRMAIIRTKLAERNFSLDDDSVRYIAENTTRSIRELEGALNRVIVSCQFHGKNPNLIYTQEILASLLSSSKKKGIKSDDILNAIVDFYGINRADLIGKGRRKDLTKARHVAMYFLRHHLNMSYPGIGSCFGGRDHTTVMHAYDKISKNLTSDSKLNDDISFLKDKIYNI